MKQIISKLTKIRISNSSKNVTKSFHGHFHPHFFKRDILKNFCPILLVWTSVVTNKHFLGWIFEICGKYEVKATGGGPGSQNHVELIWKISLSCKRCWRPHQKILFLAWVMIFWKSWFACNYCACDNFKSRYPKVASMYLLERTTHPKVLKLGLYLPWVNIYRFGLGIWEILLFWIL